MKKTSKLTLVGIRTPAKLINTSTYLFHPAEKQFFDVEAVCLYKKVIIADLLAPPTLPPKEPSSIDGLASKFCGLKNHEDIDKFAREYGLLGLAKPLDSMHDKPTYGKNLFEPLEDWGYHIEIVRMLMLNYRGLVRRRKGYDAEDSKLLDLTNSIPIAFAQKEEGATEEQVLFTSLATTLSNSLKRGIGVDFSKIVSAKDSALGYRIAEQYTTEFLLAAIYYNLWELITDNKPVETCGYCGLPIERTGRRDYCDNACKQAALRKRKREVMQQWENGKTIKEISLSTGVGIEKAKGWIKGGKK